MDLSNFVVFMDERERSVFECTSCTTPEQWSHYLQVHRLTLPVGDYVVAKMTSTGRVVPVLVVERKTWSDLRASIRDGRRENHAALVQFASSVGCRALYLIEGTSDGGTSECMTFLDRRWWEDNVCHVMVGKRSDVLERLAALVRAMDTGDCSLGKEVDVSELIKDATVSREIALSSPRMRAWLSVKSVGASSAARLVKTVRLIDVILGTHTALEIAQLAGLPVGRCELILERLSSVEGRVELLASVRGVSMKRAVELVSSGFFDACRSRKECRSKLECRIVEILDAVDK